MGILREKLLEELKYLGTDIDLTDFNSIFIGLKYHLRFELGHPHKYGTKKRVNQSTKRATQIFESFFNSDSDIYIITYDHCYKTPAYADNSLDELLFVENIIEEQFEENLALNELDEKGNIERVKGKLSIALANRNNLRYKEIFNAIANNEMGFKPFIHQIVYLFQPYEKKWFYMYDDRVCFIFSQKKSDFNEIINKYEDWII